MGMISRMSVKQLIVTECVLLASFVFLWAGLLALCVTGVVPPGGFRLPRWGIVFVIGGFACGIYGFYAFARVSVKVVKLTTDRLLGRSPTVHGMEVGRWLVRLTIAPVGMAVAAWIGVVAGMLLG